MTSAKNIPVSKVSDVIFDGSLVIVSVARP